MTQAASNQGRNAGSVKPPRIHSPQEDAANDNRALTFRDVFTDIGVTLNTGRRRSGTRARSSRCCHLWALPDDAEQAAHAQIEAASA